MVETLDTPVRDVMTQPVRTIEGDLTARDAATIMVEEGIGSVVVTDPVGVVTKTDLVVGIHDATDFGSTPVSDLMTRSLITIAPDADVQMAIDLMEEHGLKRLVVESDGVLVGIVTVTDLAEAFAVDLNTVIGMFAGTSSESTPRTFECIDCGHRLSADVRPEDCPECGGQLRNISVPRE
jgi:predicted transcriptional regulator